MSKIYKSDIGTIISLNTGQTITGATAISIEVKKPSGAIASWTAVVGADAMSVEHTVVAQDLDEVGGYILQAKLTLSGGTWRGASVNMEVKDNFK